MTTSSQPLLSKVKVEVPDDRYKSDLDLHDRFQDFSAELLKLSLAGIAVFGLFLSLLRDKETADSICNAIKSDSFFLLSAGCLAFLGLSIACALIHRFLAADGMYHHLRAIKLLILLEKRSDNPMFPFVEKEAAIKAAVTHDEVIRTEKFTYSEYFLRASAAFLFVGAVFLAATFLQVLR